MKANSTIILVLFLILFCILLYGYNMGGVGLSDPDEVFYAQTAKEMFNAQSFVTPLIFGKPQFEKPPMFYWLIGLSSVLFRGLSEFSVRFVPALFGLLGVLAIYFLGRSMFNSRTAIYASLILSTNFLYLGLSRCALTDIVFTVFILLSLLFFYRGYQNTQRRKINLCLFFLFSALAVLTKGPLGVLIPIFTIVPFLAFSKDLKFLKEIPWFWGGLFFVLVAIPWYALAALKHKEFLQSFFYYENIQRFFIAEHRSANRWYFYPFVLLGSTFPWSILFPLIFAAKENLFKKERLFLKCWFWVPLIFFTAAQSKLSSYILPIYPALSLILARSINLIEEGNSGEVRLKIGRIISTVLALIFLSAFGISLFWLKINFPQFLRAYLLLVTFVFTGIISAIIFLWRGKYNLAVFFKAATVLAFVTILMSNIISAEGTFSDRDLPDFIRQHSKGLRQEIVVSKLYARGVRYYTDKEVVVINDEKRAFFRPHPIEVISSNKEVEDYFNANESILCVVTKDHFERINSLTPRRENRVLYKNFDRYVVLSKPPGNTP